MSHLRGRYCKYFIALLALGVTLVLTIVIIRPFLSRMYHESRSGIIYDFKQWRKRANPSHTLGLDRESPTTLIAFKIDPPSSSLLIEGANLYQERRGPILNKIVIENIETRSPHPNDAPDGEAPWIAIDRSYSVRNGKIEFHNKTPLHFEITHPGFKPWISDINLENGNMDIVVKLEAE